MAGSRLEKVGSIFSRMSGLIKSGAIAEVDKPLWYEIYKAFPPKQEPLYDRPAPTNTVPNILYAEDMIRAEFNQVFGNPDVVDLQNAKVKTTCQKFIDKYIEPLPSGKDKDRLFELTAEALKSEGIRLRSLEEIKSERSKTTASEAEVINKAQQVTVQEVFGNVARKTDEDDVYRHYESDDYR